MKADTWFTRKRLRVLLIVLLGALFGFSIWRNLHPSMPKVVFNGKPLSFWLNACAKDFDGMTKQLAPGEATTAVQRIGTNAIPELLRLASANPVDVSWSIKKAIGGHVHLRDHAEEQAHSMAWLGFAALGAEAKPAVPALVTSLSNQNWNIRKSAVTSLGYIGPAAQDAITPLSQCLQDANSDVRYCAKWAMERIQLQSKITE